MKVTLESTTKIVALVLGDGREVPARVWEGTTANGVEVHAYVTRIAVANDADAREFERDLVEVPHLRPSAAIASIPLRLIL